MKHATALQNPPSGTIAGNGVELRGHGNGIIHGSLIDSLSAPMTVGDNFDLLFNRSGLTEIPAGFVPRIIMRYDPSSNMEPAL